MTLRWREFEKRTAELARAEIARSPELKKKRAAAHRGAQTQFSDVSALYFLLWGFILAPAAGWASGGIERALAALAISLTGACFLQAANWQTGIFNTRRLSVLTWFPVSTRDMFEIQFRRLQGTAIGLTLCLTFTYLTLCLWNFFSVPVAIFFALGQTILIASLALHLLAHPLRLRFGALGIALTIGWGIATLVMKINLWGESLPTWFLAVLPPAWLHQAFLAAKGEVHRMHLLWLLPFAFSVALAPRSFRKLRSLAVNALDFAFIRQHETEFESPAEPSPRMGPTEVEELTLSGDLLAAPVLQTPGVVERLALRALNEREQLLAAFLWMSTVNWTRKWRRSGIALGLAATGIFYFADTTWDVIGSFLIGLFLIVPGLPIFAVPRGLKSWPAGSGLKCAYFAGFPIGYDEIFWTILKINSVRLALTAPFWLAYGALISIFARLGPLFGLIVSVKILICVLLAQPAVVADWISNSLGPRGKLGAALHFIALLAMIFFAFSGVFLIFSKNQAISWAAVALFGVVTILWQRYRRWMFRSGRLDAITRAQR